MLLCHLANISGGISYCAFAESTSCCESALFLILFYHSEGDSSLSMAWSQKLVLMSLFDIYESHVACGTTQHNYELKGGNSNKSFVLAFLYHHYRSWASHVIYSQ